nr:hypothetical protein [uncultured Sphingomonas sp.]
MGSGIVAIAADDQRLARRAGRDMMVEEAGRRSGQDLALAHAKVGGDDSGGPSLFQFGADSVGPRRFAFADEPHLRAQDRAREDRHRRQAIGIEMAEDQRRAGNFVQPVPEDVAGRLRSLRHEGGNEPVDGRLPHLVTWP